MLDELEPVTMPLGSLGLAAHGAVLPEDVHKRVLESQREAQRKAKRRQDDVARYAQSIQAAQERARQAPASVPPPPRVPTGSLVCEACRRPLDPLPTKARLHMLC
ncbi:hypothetical protein ACI2LO_31010 [Streptomyces sp. NPDC033754]|uniref:hypothetical protein n=1 Tax=unclassified Streptomyces TaxID=2593676 RepID=UPI003408C179